MLDLKEKASNFHRSFRELDRVAMLGAATAIVPIVNSTLLLVFAPTAGDWLRENWQIGMLIYVLAAWLACGFALLPTNVIGILCGWAFGFPLGICLHMAAIVGAALISSYVLSPLVGKDFQNFLAHHEKAKVLHQSLLNQNLRRTTLVITLLRFSPAMPFSTTNLLMTAARVPLSAFLIGTFVGMLPRSAAVVFFGAGLSELNLSEPFNFWTFGFGFAATLVSVVVISYFSKQALAKMTSETA
ncbi:MAG: VTT domain-containing protein [Pyrinomonadaceae bacterium]|nr:VTT domain-containing protein [Pyrinomonadaceae bacterium]